MVKRGKSWQKGGDIQFLIFFGVWDPENIKNLVKILQCFYAVSGLKLNLYKSKLYGIGVALEEVQS